MTESDRGGSQSNAEPQWQPLSMMAALTAAINSELQINESLTRKLGAARDQPHLMDDETVKRIEQMCNGQRELLPVYRQQVERWILEARSDAKLKAIREFSARVEKHAKSTDDLLALSAEFHGKTIDSIQGMSDAELALAFLSGQIKSPR